MKVKALKELIEQLDDNAEVLVTDYKGFKSASGYLADAACLRRNPKPEEISKGVMAMSDIREFVVVATKDPLTPDWLKANTERVLVIDT